MAKTSRNKPGSVTLPESTAADALLSLDNQLCFALYSASRMVTRAYAEVLKAYDLTYPQYLVLLVLWEWDKESEPRPTVKALGERLLLDSGTLTPLLRRLEDKRLLRRKRASADERELHIMLTRAGKVLKKRIVQVPLTMLEQSSLPLASIIELREQLNRLRDRAAAA